MAFHRSPSKPRRQLHRVAVCLFAQAPLIVSWVIQAPPETARAAGQPPAVAARQGAEIFQKRCVACHNKQPDDDTPFGPPNLYTAFHGHPSLTVREAETIIRQGKGNMPGFEGMLSATEIRNVIAYLRTR